MILVNLGSTMELLLLGKFIMSQSLEHNQPVSSFAIVSVMT